MDVGQILNAPMATLLVVAGILFLYLGVGGSVQGKRGLDASGRRTATMLGVVLLPVALAMHLGILPTVRTGGTPTPVVVPTAVIPTATARPTSQPPTPTAARSQIGCPSPVSPREGAVLDNGRTDRQDTVTWDFTWSGCPGATEYNLYVMARTAQNPAVDVITPGTSYHHVREGYVPEQSRLGWTWKIRARIGGQWGPWSETRTFDVEPANSDPPS